MQDAVYLDHAASTPLDPRVKEAMDAVALSPGNPSSIHGFGRSLRVAVDTARKDVAGLFGVSPAQVVFTSGATEANVTAILGLHRSVAKAHSGRNLRVIASPLEHSSVAETLAVLAREHGVAVDLLPVGRDGVVDAAAFDALLGPDVFLVCAMWANNVLGTVQPVAEIGARIAAEKGRRGAGDPPLYFICDAVQAVRTDAVGLVEGCDALTVSAHKMYGPKGAGAMVLRPGVAPEPLIVGGGQESGRRHGTENAAGIVGFGAAARLLAAERDTEVVRLRELSASLLSLLSAIPRVRVLTDAAKTVPGIVYLAHEGVRGDELAVRLDAAGIAVSPGSACDSGKREPSAVLRAVFGDRVAATGGIRVSLGKATTEDDVRRLAAALGDIR